MAHSLGLASFWAGTRGDSDRKGTPEDELRNLLRLPGGMRIVAVLPIGAAAYPPTSARKPLVEMIHHDRFSRGAE